MTRTNFDSAQNTAVMDFLTSIASVFSDQSSVETRDLDSLTTTLTHFQVDKALASQPLLLRLIHQENEFVQLLRYRFGDAGLAMNLTRYSLIPALDSIIRTLSGLGASFLEKSRLHFNREITIFVNNHPERTQLLATALVEFSDALARTVDLIFEIRETWNHLYPCDYSNKTDADNDFDSLCASALGFKGVLEVFPMSFSENFDLQKIMIALEEVTARASNLMVHVDNNALEQSQYTIEASCEELRSRIKFLAVQTFPKAGSSTTWEIRRLGIERGFLDLDSSLSEMAQLLDSAITSESSSRLQPKGRMANSIARKLGYSLVTKGIGVNDAVAATESLARYLESTQTNVEDLIESELKNIHPQLTMELLLSIRPESNTIGAAHNREKDSNLKRLNRLAATFNDRLVQIAPLLVLTVSTFLSGCGLKTNVKSDVLEPRPDIPGLQTTLPVEKIDVKPPQGQPSQPATPDESTIDNETE